MWVEGVGVCLCGCNFWRSCGFFVGMFGGWELWIGGFVDWNFVVVGVRGLVLGIIYWLCLWLGVWCF